MSGYNMFAAKPDAEELEHENEMPETGAETSEADQPTAETDTPEMDMPAVNWIDCCWAYYGKCSASA